MNVRIGIKNQKIDYEWIVVDEKGSPLSYQVPGEDPVFLDPEKAVLQCIQAMKDLQTSLLNTQLLLSDLTHQV